MLIGVAFVSGVAWRTACRSLAPVACPLDSATLIPYASQRWGFASPEEGTA